jgi:hypothetical protein
MISFFTPQYSTSRVGDFQVAISGGIEVAVRGSDRPGFPGTSKWNEPVSNLTFQNPAGESGIAALCFYQRLG